MKLIPALIVVAHVGQAVSVASEAAQQDVDYASDPNYFNYEKYNKPDYSKQYTEPLPGADYNKRVYDYSENDQMFT